MLHIIPAPLHRALLPWAHRIRRIWRKTTKAQLIGVSVVLTNADGDVLLLRHSYGKPVWGLPGGGLARGEDPALGAKRELKEELALEAKNLNLLGELHEVISGSPHQAFVFTAKCESEGDGAPKPDQREVLEARFFALTDLPPNVSKLTLRRLDLLASQQG